MKPKIFCLYSGGLKSAGYLWQILSDHKYDDYIIHIHHVSIINHRLSYFAQEYYAKQSLNVFKQHFKRDLVFTHNQINFNCLPKFSLLPNDIDICSFIANQYISLNHDTKYIVIGSSHEDTIEESTQIKRANFALNKITKNPQFNNHASYLEIAFNLSRKDLYNILPSELQSVIWSCQYPIYEIKNQQIVKITKCKKCLKCQLLDFAKENHIE